VLARHSGGGGFRGTVADPFEFQYVVEEVNFRHPWRHPFGADYATKVGATELRQPLTDFANRITGRAFAWGGAIREMSMRENGEMAELPRFVKVEDLMKMFDVKAASTIYGWENVPPSYKPGGPDGHRRWLLSEVMEHMKALRDKPGPTEAGPA